MLDVLTRRVKCEVLMKILLSNQNLSVCIRFLTGMFLSSGSFQVLLVLSEFLTFMVKVFEFYGSRRLPGNCSNKLTSINTINQ